MCVTDCSVVHAYVAEQIGHGLSVVDAADGLRQDHADVHRFDLWTLELLELVRNGVGHHHLRGEEHRIEVRGHIELNLFPVENISCTRTLTSSIADSSMNLGASEERRPCVAMTKIL